MRQVVRTVMESAVVEAVAASEELPVAVVELVVLGAAELEEMRC